MSDCRVYFDSQPNQWLGIPRTARYVSPDSAGLAYGAQPSSDEVTGPSRDRIRVVGADIGNVTAGAAGLVLLLPDASWIAGSWTTGTSTFADDTVDAQDAGAGDFPLFVQATNNDGFIVAAKIPFNVLSVDQSTASSTLTAAYAFWGVPVNRSSATAGWQTVTTNLITPTWSDAAAERLVVLNVPASAMVATVAGDVTGLPAGYYAIRIIASTAPTPTGGSAARLYAGREIYRIRSAAANSENPIAGGTGRGPRTYDGGVALGAYYATAAVSNSLYVEYE